MTTIKDPIRQASLFTMNGLVDPRLMPGYDKPILKKETTSFAPFFPALQLIRKRLSLK